MPPRRSRCGSDRYAGHRHPGLSDHGPNFDAAQGGIFEARFDNELLGKRARCGSRGDGDGQGAADRQCGARRPRPPRNSTPTPSTSAATMCRSTGGTFNPDGTTIGRCAVDGNGLPPVPAARRCFSGHSGSHRGADATKRGKCARGAGYNHCCRDDDAAISAEGTIPRPK